MIKDYKERRQLASDRAAQHMHIKKTPRFFHKPCKGVIKEGLSCAMPAGLDNYCRIHRGK